MKKRNGEKTRQLILDTARDRFAEKGFDSASISMIAKSAGINQALIYYYFENKQAILDELIDQFINIANSFLIEIARSGYAYGSDKMIEQMERYNSCMLENEKVLRLLLTESLKDTYPVPPIFRLIDFTAEGLKEEVVIEGMNERGYNFGPDLLQHKVTEFFTGIMPTIVYSLFREKWGRHFNLKKEETDSLFKQATGMTHDRHHSDQEMV